MVECMIDGADHFTDLKRLIGVGRPAPLLANEIQFHCLLQQDLHSYRGVSFARSDT